MFRDRLHCIIHRLWIAWPVGEKDAIRLHAQHIVSALAISRQKFSNRITRQPSPAQTHTQNILLHAEVIGDHVHGPLVRVRLAGKNPLCKLTICSPALAMRLSSPSKLSVSFSRRDHPQWPDRSRPSCRIYLRALWTRVSALLSVVEIRRPHHAIVAQMADQRARINFRQYGNGIALHVLVGDLIENASWS